MKRIEPEIYYTVSLNRAIVDALRTDYPKVHNDFPTHVTAEADIIKTIISIHNNEQFKTLTDKESTRAITPQQLLGTDSMLPPRFKYVSPMLQNVTPHMHVDNELCVGT